MDRPIAELQITTTLSQQLATLHPGLQIRPHLSPRQRDFLDPELPEELGGCALLPLQFTFTKGVSFKTQNLPARSLQSQSLVTSKTLHPLIASQDLMRAMRQHRDIFSTDPTIEMTWFASCIGSPSHKELTHFVRPHTFFILNLRFDRTQRWE